MSGVNTAMLSIYVQLMNEQAEIAALRATIAAMREVIVYLNSQLRLIKKAIEKHHMVK